MNIDEFKRQPLMAILRGLKADSVEPLVETMVSSGLKTVEIAMNTPNASNIIKRTATAAAGRLAVGAGTVLATDDLYSALEAGASFIVLPTLVPDVVAYCAKNDIPVFPGGFTPQEIHNAWQAGATMVKVFPAGFLGPKYFKDIKGPFNNIELLACGGVNLDNIDDYFSCGASAVAFGGSIFKNEWLEIGDFARIGRSIESLMDRMPVPAQ
ncbi:MAG: bifunctional 4-hydroxy-2-oxoglutarate aldolase/2-dehydro-3-deoxy-phosphogluconate aldolase [Proteobacteria bacterium]|nr:bifunctional 4-hydroxy-2-oxoglutarate aldolase/2-dehydro-3-deoxy-phosphogluconate aldolase [Pseudomonadota bacterium]